MKTNILNVIDSKEVLVLPKGVSLEGIINAIKDEKGQQFLKTIDPETFKYILEESNHTKAILSLLKTLKKIDPQNANKGYAEMTLRAMRKVVRMISSK